MFSLCSSSVLLGSPLGSPRFSSVLLGSFRFSSFASVLPSVLLAAPLGSARFSSVLLSSPWYSSVLRSPPRCSRSKICKKQSRLRSSFGNTPSISHLVCFIQAQGGSPRFLTMFSNIIMCDQTTKLNSAKIL